MAIYRIKARVLGAWDFTVNAKTKADAQNKAGKIFNKTKTIKPTAEITSIEKVSGSPRKPGRIKQYLKTEEREMVRGRQIIRDRKDDLFFEVSKQKGYPYFVECFVRAKFIFQSKYRTLKEVSRVKKEFFESTVPSRFKPKNQEAVK